MSQPESNDSGARHSSAFVTTHWSVVLAVGGTSSPDAREALEDLCRTYWYPLYAYVRRRGHDPHEAQDLTQAFFERLLARNYLGQVERQKGKFRSFLLAALNHFLADEWDRAHRQKRGGDCQILSFDYALAEERCRAEPADEWTAERIYERRWATTLLDEVLRRLEAEFASAGKADQFHVLQVFLLGDKGALTYAGAAARLGLSESAVGVAIHRLRQRYGELFRAAIATTVATPEEVDEEINHLLRVLSG